MKVYLKVAPLFGLQDRIPGFSTLLKPKCTTYWDIILLSWTMNCMNVHWVPRLCQALALGDRKSIQSLLWKLTGGEGRTVTVVQSSGYPSPWKLCWSLDISSSHSKEEGCIKEKCWIRLCLSPPFKKQEQQNVLKFSKNNKNIFKWKGGEERFPTCVTGYPIQRLVNRRNKLLSELITVPCVHLL